MGIAAAAAALVALPLLFFVFMAGWLASAPPRPSATLSTTMTVEPDGVIAVEETSVIDYGDHPSDGYYRHLRPRFVQLDGSVLVREVRFVDAVEVLDDGTRRDLPADVGRTGSKVIFNLEAESTARGTRTFVLRYEIHDGLADGQFAWDIGGSDHSGVLDATETRVLGPVHAVSCPRCETAEVTAEGARLTTGYVNTSQRLTAIVALEQ